jgi:hypothetical protein
LCPVLAIDPRGSAAQKDASPCRVAQPVMVAILPGAGISQTVECAAKSAGISALTGPA